MRLSSQWHSKLRFTHFGPHATRSLQAIWPSCRKGFTGELKQTGANYLGPLEKVPAAIYTLLAVNSDPSKMPRTANLRGRLFIFAGKHLELCWVGVRRWTSGSNYWYTRPSWNQYIYIWHSFSLRLSIIKHKACWEVRVQSTHNNRGCPVRAQLRHQAGSRWRERGGRILPIYNKTSPIESWVTQSRKLSDWGWKGAVIDDWRGRSHWIYPTKASCSKIRTRYAIFLALSRPYQHKCLLHRVD